MKRFASYLYEPLLAVPASIAVLLMIAPEIGLPSASKAAALYLIIVGIACALFRYLHGKYRLILVVSAAIVLLLPALYGLRWVSSGYHYAHRYFWLIPLLGVGCDLCAVLCRHFRIMRYLAAAAVIACLTVCLIEKYILPQACVMLFLTVLLLLLIDETQLLWPKSGHTDRALHLSFVAPFVAIWLGLALLMPVGERPYDWAAFRNIWHHIQDFVVSLTQKTVPMGPDDMDVYRAGFSEDPSSPEGSVLENEDVLLRLERTGGSAADAFYLAGQYCDTLDGLNWRATVTDDTRDCEFDYMETLCAFHETDHFADFLQAIEFRVTFRKFHSRFLLAPTKTIPDRTLLARDGISEEGRNLVYNERKGINNSYVIGGYRLNRLHDIFREFMADPAEFTEESWLLHRTEYPGDASEISYEGYLTYRERMTSRYLHPFAVSDSVQTYIDTVTEGAASPFERLMCIAQDLAGFTYTTSPGALPESVTDGSSFLSYFLTSQQGYCAHFATAMTLFAWAEGLPARYVTGFLVPLGSADSIDVTGSMAHAWCEVYFENVGWIPFDATPGHSDSAFWTVYSERETTPWTPIPHTPTVVTPKPAGSAGVTTTISERGSGLRILLFVLLGMAALAFFAVLILLLDRLRSRRRFRQMDSSSRIRVLYRRNLRVLGYLGLPIGDEETLAEYRGRLLPLLPDETLDWIVPYEEFLYGTADPSSVAASMQDGYDALSEEFRRFRPQMYRLYRFVNRV